MVPFMTHCPPARGILSLAVLLAVPSVLQARQVPVARQMTLQQPPGASTDSTGPVTIQLVERWGNSWTPVLRTLPKRRIGLRITFPVSDEALARRRGRRLSVTLFVYGDGMREDRRDSLVVSAATTSLGRGQPTGWF